MICLGCFQDRGFRRVSTYIVDNYVNFVLQIFVQMET
jgi:hypothetical protein